MCAFNKPAIRNLRVTVRRGSISDFTEWQAKFNAAIAAHPGFISLEFVSLSESNRQWIIVQRFSHPESASAWSDSSEYQVLMTELKPLSEKQSIYEEESDSKENVTEVIVTEVNPDKIQDFCNWSAKIHRAEAQFPGFRGVYVQSPIQGGGNIGLPSYNLIRKNTWINGCNPK